jgi:outer membrane usher protein FimD/PapC
MEVYVNGQVVSQERVAPGRLDVRNLPLTMGRNDARVVVRDAFGQTRELSSTYYLTSTALAQGVQDYQYNVGFRASALARRTGTIARRCCSPVIASASPTPSPPAAASKRIPASCTTADRR